MKKISVILFLGFICFGLFVRSAFTNLDSSKKPFTKEKQTLKVDSGYLNAEDQTDLEELIAETKEMKK